MDRTVDELARRLAAPMPRRRVVRLLGAALALAALPNAGASAAAERAPNKRVSDHRPRPAHHRMPEGPFGSDVQCGDRICSPTYNCLKCCPGTDGGGSCCTCYQTCRPGGAELLRRRVDRVSARRPPVLRAEGALLRGERVLLEGGDLRPHLQADRGAVRRRVLRTRGGVHHREVPRTAGPAPLLR